MLQHTVRLHQGYILRPPYRVLTLVVRLRFKQPDPPISQISKNVIGEVVEPGCVKFIWCSVCEYCSRNFLLRHVIREGDVAIMRGLIMLKRMTIHIAALRSIPKLRAEKRGAFRLTTGTYTGPDLYGSCSFALLVQAPHRVL